MTNVCNMEEVAEIEIYKEGNKYYLNFIAHDEISTLINVEEGCWEEKRISRKDIIALCNIVRGSKK